MSYSNNSNTSNRFSSNSKAGTTSRPAAKTNTTSRTDTGAAKEKKKTSHYMVTGGKGDDRQFVQGLFISEANGFEGLQVSIPEEVTLVPGVYFINKKRDKSADANA